MNFQGNLFDSIPCMVSLMQLRWPEVVVKVTQMFMPVYNLGEFLSDDFTAEGLIHLRFCMVKLKIWFNVQVSIVVW